MPNYGEWLRALRTAVAVGRKQHVTVTAAGLSYYAFNSLVPLLLLVTIAVSIVYDPETTATALESSPGSVPPRSSPSSRRSPATAAVPGRG